MKTFTTNCSNTFVSVSADCRVQKGEAPPMRNGEPTAAYIQYELISRNPYKFTSDEILFMVHAVKEDLPSVSWQQEKDELFAKAQQCMKSSPLALHYGWGIHHNADGKVAIHCRSSKEYSDLMSRSDVKIVRPKRSAKRSDSAEREEQAVLAE